MLYKRGIWLSITPLSPNDVDKQITELAVGWVHLKSVGLDLVKEIGPTANCGISSNFFHLLIDTYSSFVLCY